MLEARPGLAGPGFAVSFLDHGGHLWDKAYAITDLALALGPDFAVIDINAIEGISQEVVPEPAGFALMTLGLVGLGCRSRRRNRS